MVIHLELRRAPVMRCQLYCLMDGPSMYGVGRILEHVIIHMIVRENLQLKIFKITMESNRYQENTSPCWSSPL